MTLSANPIPEAPAGAPAVPPVQTPAAVPPVPPPVVAAPPALPAIPSSASRAPRTLGESDEPAPGEEVVLSTSALSKRMDRYSKKQLKDLFGTDDPAAIQASLAKVTAYEAEQETARKAALTETQRLTEERNVALERASAAEARAEEIEYNRQADAVDGEIRTVALEFVKPKFWNMVRGDLAEHISATYTEAQLEQLEDKAREKIVRDWLGRYVTDNPEVKAGTAPAPATLPTAPLTNGVANPGGRGPEARPTPNSGANNLAGKTLKPGQPNSMTAAELAQWKRSTGNNY
jgi:hypothetical protein